MDASSEFVHGLLPIFLTVSLGASMTMVGLIEGSAEATAALVKIFSGWWSDRVGNRKWPTVFGYGLAAITKPVFPLAGTVAWVFGARFVDRVGKGIRGAPRDALIADVTPAELRGAAYGLRQGLDSVGALIGPLLAIGAMLVLAGNIRAALWIPVVPAVIAVIVLVLFVHEPEPPPRPAAAVPFSFALTRNLPRAYWLVVLLGALLTLARFSEAFLVLRAHGVGLSAAYTPAIMVVMNVVYAGGSYPAGVAADRLSNRMLLAVGLIVLVAADLVLAFSVSIWSVLFGAALWGAHMALSQGLFSKLVADTAPPELRGSAFGMFSLVGGVMLLLASGLAGLLWSLFGPIATFLSGAGFALAALIGLLLLGSWVPATPAREAR